jgi:lipoic acid synthetase
MVKTGNPKGVINQDEIPNSAKMVGIMSLKYVVITSVDRDDVADHGAGHFAAVVSEVHRVHPETKVEVLIPDFAGIPEHMHTLAKSNPFVIAQNIETVRRLTHPVRDPRAGYDKTLACLDFYKKNYPHIQTKTSIQVGHGETWEEIQETLIDLRAINCDIVTFGQYLQPAKRHLDVKKFYTPEDFNEMMRLSIAATQENAFITPDLGLLANQTRRSVGHVQVHLHQVVGVSKKLTGSFNRVPLPFTLRKATGCQTRN